MKFPKWLKIYGDIDFRGNCPLESAEQITAFNWLRANGFSTALHPRNEGKRTHSQTSRQKAEGMTAGASDVIIPSGQSFVCEIKRKDHTKSTWQSKQLDFLEQCHKDGAFVCVALGHQGLIEAVRQWKK